jgi:hypothetical protein
MKRVLVVANQTAGGEHLKHEVMRRIKEGPHRFTLLVPATKPSGTMTWTDGEAHAQAEKRMKHAVESLREAGAEVEGMVGFSVPIDAIADTLRAKHYDEIIISTLPHRISHWLRLDLPARAESLFGLPVTHIVAADEMSKSGAA